MITPMIDLIVTHYDEPWEIGKPFFDMLAMQRLADFNQIRVILVQDGKENALDVSACLANYPYRVKVATIPHTGVSAARNAGLRVSQADWVMFCDFDDMFSSVYSMMLMLNVLPTDAEDCLHLDIMHEERRGHYKVNVLSQDFTTVTGKLYRRQTLLDKGIYFPEDMYIREDVVFNESLFMSVPAFRIKKIVSDYPLYTKTLREDSLTNSTDALQDRVDEMLMENILLTRIADTCGLPSNVYVSRALMDCYIILNTPDLFISERIKEIAIEFIRNNADTFSALRQSEVELELDISTYKIDRFAQYLHTQHGIDIFPPMLSVSDANTIQTIKDWLVYQAVDVPTVKANQNERIVVYCGTENVYDSMVTSAKTLLAHTHVDRIYFLTEHDTFPMPIPDCITNINVSNQTFFRKDGPNYKSTWTYMCLMRAAFTKLFPQYSKVLSLDIDIAINDDISDLWDYDLSDYYLAGVHETDRPTPDYINFGVVLMNLDKLRTDGMDDTIITALNTTHWDCPEQSAFSELCTGHILLLPSDYNYAPNVGIMPEPQQERITHYAGVKYWKHYSAFRKFASMSWDQIIALPDSDQGGQDEQERQDNMAPDPVPASRHEHVAAYIGTRNQYHMMLLSAKSLLATTPMDRIYFLLEEDSFPEPLPDCITCINVSGQHYFNEDGPNYHSDFSYMPMLRAAYPDMFPEHDRILSLDNDTIIKHDISGFFDMDLSNYYFAAALEARPGRQVSQPYFNTGVMLMNLTKMRQDHIDTVTIDDLNSTHYLNDSQDALNVSCENQILLVPSDYNACMFTARSNHIIIRHFAGKDKPYFDQYAEPYNKPWEQILRKES